jgi:hypothetical protein
MPRPLANEPSHRQFLFIDKDDVLYYLRTDEKMTPDGCALFVGRDDGKPLEQVGISPLHPARHGTSVFLTALVDNHWIVLDSATPFRPARDDSLWKKLTYAMRNRAHFGRTDLHHLDINAFDVNETPAGQVTITRRVMP